MSQPKSSVLIAAHVVGDNALTILDPSKFSPLFPFKLVAQVPSIGANNIAPGTKVVFTATSLSGNVLSVTPVSGYNDVALPVETVISEFQVDEPLLTLEAMFDSQGRKISAGSAPTIAAGTGAGTSPTVAIGTGSNDVAGKVNVTAGTSPSTGAVIGTVTFNKPFAAAPKAVLLQPANAATAAIIANAYVSSITTTGFVISAGASGLTGAGVYSWYYKVEG